MKKIDSALILAGITAYLYCSSTAYMNGFFQIFHLDSDVLDRNFHQILYLGLIRNLKPLMYGPMFFVIGLMLYEIIAYNVKVKFPNPPKLFISFRNLANKQAWLQSYGILTAKSITLFVLSLIFLGAMLIFEMSGRGAAQEIKKSISDNNYSKILVVLNGKQRELVYLYCGTRNCAGLDKEKNQIEYFKQDAFSLKRKSLTSQNEGAEQGVAE